MDIIKKLKEKMEERRDCQICGNNFFIKDIVVSFCGHILCKDCGFEAEVRGKCLICPSIISLAKEFKKLEIRKNKTMAIPMVMVMKGNGNGNGNGLEKEKEELENRKLKILKTDTDREIFEKQFL